MIGGLAASLVFVLGFLAVVIVLVQEVAAAIVRRAERRDVERDLVARGFYVDLDVVRGRAARRRWKR